jgi:hypothetical protein
MEDNNKNGVQHATASFHGTDASGSAVNLNGHFQFAMNASGQPTAIVGTVTCWTDNEWADRLWHFVEVNAPSRPRALVIDRDMAAPPQRVSVGWGPAASGPLTVSVGRGRRRGGLSCAR